MAGTRVGYLRVSSIAQYTERQLDGIRSALRQTDKQKCITFFWLLFFSRGITATIRRGVKLQMTKKFLRVAAIGAATTVAAGGMALAVAAPASAAPVKGKIKISAPDSVKSGSMFTINCKAKKVLRGERVWLKEQGAAFHATRTVSNNGDCTIRVMTGLKGTHTFVIKSSKNGKVYKSNAVKIRVS